MATGTQFSNSNSTGKKKKTNRFYWQRNFVSVKVRVNKQKQIVMIELLKFFPISILF